METNKFSKIDSTLNLLFKNINTFPNKLIFICDQEEVLDQITIKVINFLNQSSNTTSYNNDIIKIGDYKKLIKKSEIQNIINQFSYESLIANQPKIYIIKGVDLLTKNAANSLLKFLEEPPSNTYAVLLTKDIKSVLSTIISRSIVKNLNQNIDRVNNQNINQKITKFMAAIKSRNETLFFYNTFTIDGYESSVLFLKQFASYLLDNYNNQSISRKIASITLETVEKILKYKSDKILVWLFDQWIIKVYKLTSESNDWNF